MMKTWLAFLGGAVIAGGLALVFAFRQAPTTPAATVSPEQVTTTIPQIRESGQTSSEPSTSRFRSNSSLRSRRNATPAVAVSEKESPDQVAHSQVPTAITPLPADPAPVPEPTRQRPVAEPASPPPPARQPEPNSVTLAAGTAIIVRLSQSISSDNTHDGQTFEATLDQPLIVDGFAIAERGARVEGRIIDVEKAGRVKGVSHLSLELVRINTSDGQRVALSTQSWDKEGEQTRKKDAEKIAAGAGVGAALGAIFGGGKGAAIGAGTGGAAGTGVVLGTRGKPIVMPVESKISFRLKNPITITEKR